MPVKAELRIDRLAYNLQRYLDRNDRDWDDLRRDWGEAGVERVKYEDLMAFEHGDLQPSIKAWKTLFHAWGFHLTVAQIQRLLEDTGDVGSRRAPADHTETVYNWDEVREFLCRNGSKRIISLMRDKRGAC